MYCISFILLLRIPGEHSRLLMVDYVPMIVKLRTEKELLQARALVEEAGLSFDERYDVVIGSYEGDRLVATAARDGIILKMFAVDRRHQAGMLLDELATELVKDGFDAGHDNFFIFTKPEYAVTFQGLNFALLASNSKAALLEYGGGLPRYLEQHRKLVRGGRNGAAVVNCNPFTLGHRYLVERAAAEVDHLYLFVVREDRSVFPFEVRYRLVREGVSDLANVHVLDTSRYAVSSVTFPSYFLKGAAEADNIRMDLDLQIFGRHIAPFFGIKRRFIGTEPCCSTTYFYNEAMKSILPPLHVEVTEIPRREVDEGVISASSVRKMLSENDTARLASLVPENTLRYLLSEEAADIRRRLLGHTGRH